MAKDKNGPEALDDAELGAVAGAGAQTVADMAAETNDDDPITAAAGSSWSKPFRKLSRDLK